MSSTENKSCEVHCSGDVEKMPMGIHNRPAQPDINYRVGTHAEFKKSMLRALSNVKNPALKELGTRDDNDFTIAWLDAVATTLDVVTFYQERFANEHYLASSRDRQSVGALAELIGYQLAPGVSASTHLAFTLQETPGLEQNQFASLEIPSGSKVQSVPGPGEQAQTFETMEPIFASAAWNNIKVQNDIPYRPKAGDAEIYIDGVDNTIVPGDSILIVSSERAIDPKSKAWEIRQISAVKVDKENLRTHITWDLPLSASSALLNNEVDELSLFVFRNQVALFGHNAPDPRLMPNEIVGGLQGVLKDYSGNILGWEDYQIQNNKIDLSLPLAKITSESWLGLIATEENPEYPSEPGEVLLCKTVKVFELSRKDYGLNTRITRAIPDLAIDPDKFTLQGTTVLAESEVLDIAPRPISYPLYGDYISLGKLQLDLQPGKKIAISGIRQLIKVAEGVNHIVLEFYDGWSEQNMDMRPGDYLTLISPPEKKNNYSDTPTVLSPEEFNNALKESSSQLLLTVKTRDGKRGSVLCKGNDLVLVNSDDDEIENRDISEIVEIASTADAVIHDKDRSYIKLAKPLKHLYERASVRLNFNVAVATHGESVSETLGSGNTRIHNQKFSLKQSPLSYVSADTPSGRQSTLELSVNDMSWLEAPSLYGQRKEAHSYSLESKEEGGSVVQFGDGIEGALLPTGQANVVVNYRKGLGVEGNIARGRLSTLLTRSLGVVAVTNPEPSAGGENPEQMDAARHNAPMTVTTLDRAVSISDYQHFAQTFAGVDKAHAMWLSSGPARGVFLSVAGVDGSVLDENGETFINLAKSLRRFGDPLVPITLKNFRKATFSLSLSIKTSDKANTKTVMSAISSLLRSHFSFTRRQFGQDVSRDEIVSVVHSIPEISAVRVNKFFKNPIDSSKVLKNNSAANIFTSVSLSGKVITAKTMADLVTADLPSQNFNTIPEAAELLCLSDEPIPMELLV